ncbi:MAG: hypothetical protein VB144_08895 [Clostridia bacterium]|nr:hypothetical protein [Clostridia bacterium]
MIYMHADEERQRVFRSAYRHLENSGLLAFDFDAGTCQPGESNPWLGIQDINPDTGGIVVQTVQMKTIDPTLRLVDQISYRHNGSHAQITVEASLESTCSPSRMKEMLAGEGFRAEGFYSDYAYSPYVSGDEGRKPRAGRGLRPIVHTYLEMSAS